MRLQPGVRRNGETQGKMKRQFATSDVPIGGWERGINQPARHQRRILVFPIVPFCRRGLGGASPTSANPILFEADMTLLRASASRPVARSIVSLTKCSFGMEGEARAESPNRQVEALSNARAVSAPPNNALQLTRGSWLPSSAMQQSHSSLRIPGTRPTSPAALPPAARQGSCAGRGQLSAGVRQPKPA